MMKYLIHESHFLQIQEDSNQAALELFFISVILKKISLTFTEGCFSKLFLDFLSIKMKTIMILNEILWESLGCFYQSLLAAGI